MANEKPGTTSTPVYVPYATFLSAVDALKRDGIPGTGKIDKSLWDSQSGAIQGQILLAFRFLGLIDEHNRVLPSLQPLVDASSEERKPIIRRLVETSYAALFHLDLNTITQGQLEEALRAFGIGGSTLDRAVRFFVKACQETGIPISKRVSEKVRSGASAPRRRRVASNGGSPRRLEDEPQSTPPVTPIQGWEDKLLAKFPEFDPSWPEPLKNKWFEGFERLMGAKVE